MSKLRSLDVELTSVSPLPPRPTTGSSSSAANVRGDERASVEIDLERGDMQSAPARPNKASRLCGSLWCSRPSRRKSSPKNKKIVQPLSVSASPKAALAPPASDEVWFEVLVSVADTGVGIPAGSLRQLFQPYMQLAAGALQRGQGTGLGLSISKSLIQLHGGRIGCHSTPGAGSSFFFVIPMKAVLIRESVSTPQTVHKALSVLGTNESNSTSSIAVSPLPVVPAQMITSTHTTVTSAAISPVDPEHRRHLLTLETTTTTQSLAYLPETTPPNSPWTQLPETNVSLATYSSTAAALASPTVASVMADRTVATPLSDNVTVTGTVPLVLSSIVDSSPLMPPLVRAKLEELKFIATSSPKPAVFGNAAMSAAFAAPNITLPHSVNATTSATKTVRSLKVLIVEDSPPTRKLVAKMLERWGFQSQAVENGQLCVDLFPCSGDPSTSLTSPFHVILMDNFMPVKTGEEAARELRALGYVQQPYIIGLTGNALPEDVARFQEAGANMVLTKPVNQEELLSVLEGQEEALLRACHS